MSMDKVPFVVMVDDDEDDLLLAQEAFEDSGLACNLVSFEDGLKLLEFLDGSIMPDMIVLDISMPFMDGCQVIDEIREIPGYSRVPIAILTTSQKENIQAECIKKAKCFFVKPVNFSDWIQIIRQMVNDCLM